MRVILRQPQSPGDVLTFTRAVADLKLSYPDWEIDVRSPCSEIWENNPHLTPLRQEDDDVKIISVSYDDINISGWNGLHFTDAYRNDLERKLEVPIEKTGIRPELYISTEEQGWINQVEVEFGWPGAFWILNAGHKPDNQLKQYHRWQDVVDIFNERFNDKVRLVQVGHKDHKHSELDGAYSLLGKTDLRQLIRLCWWAHGTLGPISLQMVISAAFNQPAVVVAGGKEGVRWHLYPHMRWLATNGALKCCDWDGCWLGGESGMCKDLTTKGVPRCFDLIEPYQIVDAIEMYYKGGILGEERGK